MLNQKPFGTSPVRKASFRLDRFANSGSKNPNPDEGADKDPDGAPISPSGQVPEAAQAEGALSSSGGRISRPSTNSRGRG